MKPLLLAAAALLVTAVPAGAQTASMPPLMRGDVAGTIGWLNGNTGDNRNESSNDWYNRGLYAGAHIGRYWTEHHKTEIEGGVTNGIEFRTYGSTSVDGIPGWSTSLFTYSLRRIAVGEHYQFGHNTWVHPHVGAGLDLTWERVLERADPVIGYDPGGRESRELRPAATIGPTTTLRARPYIETGFKAYLSPRAFFRGDLRLLVRGGVREVLLRGGFGFDF